MLDDLGGADRAQPQRLLEPGPRASPARNPRRTGRRRRWCRPAARSARPDLGPLAAAHGERALLAAGDDQGLAPWPRRRDRASKSRYPAQRLDLGLVGEQDVDPAARRSARGSRRGGGRCRSCRTSVNATLRPASRADLDRPDHRAARVLGVPQIAFEIEDRGVARSRLVERVAGRNCAAPRKVFIVRCPSGVTRIRQRAVGADIGRAAGVELDPEARMSWMKISPAGRRPPGR